MTPGSNERADAATHCVECNSKSQEDQAGTWPSLREAGKEPLQPMPPRGTKTSQKEASFLRRGLDPQIECFLCTTCRFFGYSRVWVKLKMYDPASDSDSDGLGAIACTEFFHNVLNMSLYCFLRDEKERCDVAVSISSGDLLKDLNLSRA
jgi:hypothetical protein